MGFIVLMVLVVMLLLIWGMNQFGWYVVVQVLLWIGLILFYVLLLFFDLCFGFDGQNLFDEVIDWLENDKYYCYCIYIYILFQYFSVVLGVYLFIVVNFSWFGFDGVLSWVGKFGVVLLVGVFGGVGINIVYEMGYKKDLLEWWLFKIIFVQICYGYFYIEYNCGYYVWVFILEDLVLVWFGEMLWEFLFCSVIGGLCLVVYLEV